jgi:hypothetical protein
MGFKTCAVTGVESVQYTVDNDAKQGVTVIATIRATRKKLALPVIGKDTTRRYLAGYELTYEIWGNIANPGRQNRSPVLCWYSSHLRHGIFPGGPLSLILDTASAHRSAEVREMAQLWRIYLVSIQLGGRYQPASTA